MIDITCSDCGATHEVRRRNAKYCPACRLIRDVSYAIKKFRRVRTCRACDESYRPIHAQDYDFCGACAPPPHDGPRLHCAVCQEFRHLLPGTLVCAECLKDPDQQKRILTRLRTSQKRRIRDNSPAAA